MTSQNLKNYARYDPLPPTYKRLKEAGAKKFAETATEAGVKNRLSALNVFMKHFNFTDKDIVGPEFDVEFESYVLQFKENMAIEGKADRTIQDRVEFLTKWRELVFQLADSAELPDDFHEALTEAMQRRRISSRQLAQITRIADTTIYWWMSGKTRPTRNVESQIKKIEEALRLPPDTLASRLGFVIKRKQITAAAKENKLKMSSYTARLSRQWKREHKLRYLIDVPESIQAEWKQLVKYKTSILREHASSNDVWRVKPLDKIGNKPRWFGLVDDFQYVPAADACWSFIGRYFSWLALDIDKGGAGYAVERINTLAWVLNQELMKQFLAWHQERSGNILHGGIISVLHYSAMLLRPKTGFLWCNPQFARKLDKKARVGCLGFEIEGMDLDELSDAWQKRCEQVWDRYQKDAKFLDGHKSKKKAREPKERISDILAHPRPLSVVIDMLAAYKKNPPSCLNTKRYAVWTRDVLLLAWLTANPLRIGHFALMKYSPDNTENLYRHEDGYWHYRCARDDFKNSPKQYMNTPEGLYDVRLPEYVGEAIELYLKEGRPLLAGAHDGNYLFLPEKFANKTEHDRTGAEVPVFYDRWNSDAMSTRVRIITQASREGNPGFGPHAFRHIVATDYLKRYPGAYKLVADLLCDRLDTVIKEYGHTSAQDGLDVHYASANAEYAAAMGASSALIG